MSMTPEQNGTRPSATVQQLREQIAQDRRELSETMAALHDKADVKAQIQEKVHEKATDAETAITDLAAQLGRTAHSALRFGRWAAGTAVDQVRNVTPRPVRVQAERVGELVQRELRYVVAASTAAVAAVTWRWWRQGLR